MPGDPVEDLAGLIIGFTWGPILVALVTCIYGAPLIIIYGLAVGLRTKWNAVRMTLIPIAAATPLLVLVGWWIIARDLLRELWETGMTTLTSYDRVVGTALFLVCCSVMFIFWSIAIGSVVTPVRLLRLVVSQVRAKGTLSESNRLSG